MITRDVKCITRALLLTLDTHVCTTSECNIALNWYCIFHRKVVCGGITVRLYLFSYKIYKTKLGNIIT